MLIEIRYKAISPNSTKITRKEKFKKSEFGYLRVLPKEYEQEIHKKEPSRRPCADRSQKITRKFQPTNSLFVTFVCTTSDRIFLVGGGGVSNTGLVESTAGEQVVLSAHEVRVASDTGLLVEPRDDVVQESSGSSQIGGAVDISSEGELGDPDLGEAVVASSADGLGDEGLELVGGVTVPVNGHTGDAAAGAGVHEGVHPAETLAVVGGGARGGSDELGLTRVGGDVRLVVVGGIRRAHVGLGGNIGLVEAHDVVATAGEDSLDGANPAAEVPSTPEHGDELDTVGQGAGERTSPVVGPGNGVAGAQGRHGGDVVVGSTALAGGGALGLLHGGGDGRGGDEAGSEQLSEGDHFEHKR